MENLSHLCGPFPVSSMAATNTVSDNQPAMPGPGSASESAVTPPPWTGTELGGAHTPTVMHPEAPAAAAPGDPWSYTSKVWVEASDQTPAGGNQHRPGPWRQA